MIHNNSCTSHGRVWVIWDPNMVRVNCIDRNDQILNCHVEVLNKQVSFFASFVYGYNNVGKRRALWRSVCSHATLVANAPWILLGDFL